MNAIKMLSDIRSKLEENGFTSISESLNAEIDKCSTGNEMIGAAGFFLRNLKLNNKKAFDLIEVEIEIFIRYCNSVGIVIK